MDYMLQLKIITLSIPPINFEKVNVGSKFSFTIQKRLVNDITHVNSSLNFDDGANKWQNDKINNKCIEFQTDSYMSDINDTETYNKNPVYQFTSETSNFLKRRNNRSSSNIRILVADDTVYNITGIRVKSISVYMFLN